MRIASTALVAPLLHRSEILPPTPTCAFSSDQQTTTRRSFFASKSTLDGFPSDDVRTITERCDVKGVGGRCDMLEVDLDLLGDVAAGEDEGKATRKRIAASILGVATAQLHSNKAIAIGLGLTGSLLSGDVADINPFQAVQQITTEHSSPSSIIVNEQSSKLKTAPSSPISISLHDALLLADNTESIEREDSIVGTFFEKMADMKEEAETEKLDEAQMKRKVHQVKGKARENVRQIEQQYREETVAKKMQEPKMQRGYEIGDRERTILQEVNEKAEEEAKRIERQKKEELGENQSMATEQRVKEEAATKNLKEQHERERLDADQSLKDESATKLKDQREAEYLVAIQKAKDKTGLQLRDKQERERLTAEQEAEDEPAAELKEEQERERLAAEQKAKDKTAARLKEEQERERLATEHRAKDEAPAKLQQEEEERKARDEAAAKLQEHQEQDYLAEEEEAKSVAQDAAVVKSKKQQGQESLAAEQKRMIETAAKLKEQQKSAHLALDQKAQAAEQKARDEAVSKLEEQNAQRRLVAGKRAKSEASAQEQKFLAAEHKTQDEAVAKLKEQSLAAGRTARDEAAELDVQQKARAEAEQERLRAEHQARIRAEEEKIKQEAEQQRFETEVRMLENEKMAAEEKAHAEEKEREEAAIGFSAKEAELTEEKMAKDDADTSLAGVQKPEKERLFSEKARAEFDQEWAKIEEKALIKAVEIQKEQKNAMLKLEQRVERLEAQVQKLDEEKIAAEMKFATNEEKLLKLQREADDTRILLEAPKRVEQPKKEDAERAESTRKAADARIKSLAKVNGEKLPLMLNGGKLQESLDLFIPKATQLKESLDTFKSKTLPLYGEKLQESLELLEAKSLSLRGEMLDGSLEEITLLSGLVGTILVAAVLISIRDIAIGKNEPLSLQNGLNNNENASMSGTSSVSPYQALSPLKGQLPGIPMRGSFGSADSPLGQRYGNQSGTKGQSSGVRGESSFDSPNSSFGRRYDNQSGPRGQSPGVPGQSSFGSPNSSFGQRYQSPGIPRQSYFGSSNPSFGQRYGNQSASGVRGQSFFDSPNSSFGKRYDNQSGPRGQSPGVPGQSSFGSPNSSFGRRYQSPGIPRQTSFGSSNPSFGQRYGNQSGTNTSLQPEFQPLRGSTVSSSSIMGAGSGFTLEMLPLGDGVSFGSPETFEKGSMKGSMQSAGRMDDGSGISPESLRKDNTGGVSIATSKYSGSLSPSASRKGSGDMNPGSGSTRGMPKRGTLTSGPKSFDKTLRLPGGGSGFFK